MRRLRIGFAALALLLLLPLAILVWRSVETLAREHELRHAAVASRVFDEAEAALAGFLGEERARPVWHYRPPGGGRPSPLAAASAEPFVLAHFQLDHRGRLQLPGFATPQSTLDEVREAVARTSSPGDADEQQAPEKKDVSPMAQATSEAAAAPAPGTARVVQNVELLTGRGVAAKERADALEELADDRAEGGESDGALSSYDALREIGRVAKTSRRQVARKREAEAPAERRARSMEPAAAPPPTVMGDAVAPSREPSAARAPAPAGEALRIEPSPLSGVRLGPQRLLLHRTAVVEAGVALRQGMLIDLAQLANWLEERVLGGGALGPSIDLAFPGWGAGEAEAGALAETRFVYDYRFDAPFEALTVRLALAPLRDAGGARYIYWMAALLLVASTLGLFALYRMAAVTVRFAERRSNFAASVSHELKTPLTSIRMYAEMLRDGMVGDDAKRAEYYGTITAESERLSRLIDNVLEWSKLEKDQRPLALVTASVERPIRDVVRALRPHAEARGFELRVDLPDGLPPAQHDPDALQQVLFNLVDNALKYAADPAASAPRRIEITVAPKPDEGGLVLRVRDHGRGVDESELPLLFDAFYRSGDELTRQTKGTGIGLALVRGLAEAMGGRVTARNHPEGGFVVELELVA